MDGLVGTSGGHVEPQADNDPAGAASRAAARPWTLRLASRLWGEPASVPLEHRLFNAIVLFGLITGVILTVQNLAMGHPSYMTGLTLTTGAVSLYAYLKARRGGRWRPLLVPTLGSFFVLLGLGWVTQAGSEGSLGYFFLLTILAAVVLFEGRSRMVALGLTLGLLLALAALEALVPALILPYPSPGMRFGDVIFALVLSLLVAAGMMAAVYAEYQREREAKERLLEQVMAEKAATERSMHEKQRLLSMVCHDIANALQIVQGGVELARQRAHAEDANLSRMGFAARNIEEIIDSVRMMQAVEQGRIALQLQAVALGPVFEKVRRIFEARLAERSLVLDMPPGDDVACVPVLADARILANHVLNNLVSNAIKFSYKGSRIGIHVEAMGDEVWIAVEDHGIGIPSELVERLFEPNAQTSRLGTSGEPGTGFGLFTAKSFVDHFGGRMSVASRCEQEHPDTHGTIISVILRRAG